MTNHIFLSAMSAALILAGVPLLAMLTTLVLGTYGEPERSHKVWLSVTLTAIWATAILVVVSIKLQI